MSDQNDAENIRDELPYYEPDTIQAALSGDYEAGMEALHLFVESVLGGQGISRELLEYIADCLNKITKSEDPKAALNLSKGVGRPSKPSEPSRVKIRKFKAVAVYELLIRSGLRPEQAIEEISTITGSDRRTIQRWRKEFDGLEDWSEKSLIREAGSLTKKFRNFLPHT